jgi:hypothetical protein
MPDYLHLKNDQISNFIAMYWANKMNTSGKYEKENNTNSSKVLSWFVASLRPL